MRIRIYGTVLAVLMVWLSVGLSAQAPESTTQMSLANSLQFRTRLMYLMTQQARTVKAEVLNTSCHSLRSNYANTVIGNPSSAAVNAAVMMVGGVNLIGTVIGNTDPDLIDSSATDAAILSQVATFWNALSTCDTGV